LFDALSRVAPVEGAARRWLNYPDLSVQPLSPIYEGLLNFDLIANGQWVAVRPQAFARTPLGSYYTSKSLVLLVISRTVGPQLDDRQAAFAECAAVLASSLLPVAERLAKLTTLDPATRFGHFLVNFGDYLAHATLAAVAGAPHAVPWKDYVSPWSVRLEAIRVRIRTLADANGWAVADEQLDLRQLMRRIILKRMIYDVDKDPMAVELAKLSLQLHSLTVGAPLSVLDHHLRCDDSPSANRCAGPWTAWRGA
jgi:hypothetical protein